MVERDSAVLNPGRLDPATAIGAVALTVTDLERSRAFYTSVLGMTVLSEGADGSLSLGGPDGVGLLELTGDPIAPARNPRETGLFHFAVLMPSRPALAQALVNVATSRWPLSGASDHLVSEALYLNDPDGNGIEIYQDRPRSEWPHDASGALEMATLALDLDDVIGELGGGTLTPGELSPGTRMGHVHLQVASLPEAEAFYAGVLGFDVTVRGYPGALFVAAGGYHHHIGLNTWNSRGGSAPSPGSVGLRSFEVHTGSAAALAAVTTRLRGAGLELAEDADGVRVTDPSGIHVRLSA